MNFNEIRNNFNLVNSVDWDMTPEEAIALHLEWGPLRDLSYYNSRDSENETVYFVVNTWKKDPVVTLIRRKGFDSEELANFTLPDQLEQNVMDTLGKHKGVYAVEGEIREWLRKELYVS